MHRVQCTVQDVLARLEDGRFEDDREDGRADDGSFEDGRFRTADPKYLSIRTVGWTPRSQRNERKVVANSSAVGKLCCVQRSATYIRSWRQH